MSLWAFRTVNTFRFHVVSGFSRKRGVVDGGHVPVPDPIRGIGGGKRGHNFHGPSGLRDGVEVRMKRRVLETDNGQDLACAKVV